MAYDEDLAARLRDELGVGPGVEERRMFGGLAFLVDGHLAVAAASDGGLMVRCDPEQTEELVRRGAHPFEMRGRAMRGWLRVDAPAPDDHETLAAWVGTGLGYVRTLPPK